ncbi:copper amine oxidase N-terminal domain-containing protein [Tissierella creatinini]|nr:copper amine oxidase N-terminal domain-containing protein [Tissierella creatinini]TJX60692.1 copper amine oxidase N-terminal domain-containing protein [Soehngenia saccharolytica]
MEVVKYNRKEFHMKKPRILMMFLIIAIVLTSIPTMAEGSLVKVIVNGKPLLPDVLPFNDSGMILVPIRFVAEELGYLVEYVEETSTIKISKEDKNVELTVSSKIALVDGRDIPLDGRSFINNDRTFVPLSFIAKAFDEEVVWDAKNQIAIIGKFKGQERSKNSFLFTNEEYGYTLNFPNSWKEEAIIETRDGNLYVYDRKSAEKFIAEGFNSFGPVFEVIRSGYPVITTVPYDTNYVIDFEIGSYYLEAIFDLDFQYYPGTRDSYKKIWDEGQEVLASYKRLEDTKLIDKESYDTEIGVLNDILDNYVPMDIFSPDEIYTLRKPNPESTLLYLKKSKDDNTVIIKLEVLFNNKHKLTQYHLKNYSYELEENNLSQEEALELANNFIKIYVDKNIELLKTPDLFPSLYEEEKHEAYGDSQWKHVVVVDLEYGFVEYYGLLGDKRY